MSGSLILIPTFQSVLVQDAEPPVVKLAPCRQLTNAGPFTKKCVDLLDKYTLEIASLYSEIFDCFILNSKMSFILKNVANMHFSIVKTF